MAQFKFVFLFIAIFFYFYCASQELYHVPEGTLDVEAVKGVIEFFQSLEGEELANAQSVAQNNDEIQEVITQLRNALEAEKSPEGLFLINILLMRLIIILQTIYVLPVPIPVPPVPSIPSIPVPAISSFSLTPLNPSIPSTPLTPLNPSFPFPIPGLPTSI